MRLSGDSTVRGRCSGNLALATVLAMLLAGALSGCSTPMPPYVPKSMPPPVAPAGSPIGAAAGSASGTAPAGAPATEAPAALAAAAGLPEARGPAGPPYGDAVAARFPEPPVSYRTPAFEPGRSTFTSNAELATLLRSLVREGRNAPGGTTVRLVVLGSSQNGVPLEALLFTRNADPSPAALLRAGAADRAADRPTAWR